MPLLFAPPRVGLGCEELTKGWGEGSATRVSPEPPAIRKQPGNPAPSPALPPRRCRRPRGLPQQKLRNPDPISSAVVCGQSDAPARPPARSPAPPPAGPRIRFRSMTKPKHPVTRPNSEVRGSACGTPHRADRSPRPVSAPEQTACWSGYAPSRQPRRQRPRMRRRRSLCGWLTRLRGVRHHRLGTL